MTIQEFTTFLNAAPDYQKMIRRWQPILEHPGLPEIKDPYTRKTTMVIL